MSKLLSAINTQLSPYSLKFYFDQLTYKINVINASSTTYTLQTFAASSSFPSTNTLLERLGLIDNTSQNSSITISASDTTVAPFIPDLSLQNLH